jgi:hypothetical protein
LSLFPSFTSVSLSSHTAFPSLVQPILTPHWHTHPLHYNNPLATVLFVSPASPSLPSLLFEHPVPVP